MEYIASSINIIKKVVIKAVKTISTTHEYPSLPITIHEPLERVTIEKIEVFESAV